MLNKFLVAGRLTADPEIQTIGENRLCKFTIACDRPKRKELCKNKLVDID